MEVFEVGTASSTLKLSGLANANFVLMNFRGVGGNYTLDFSGQLQNDTLVNVIAGLGNIRIVIPLQLAAVVKVSGNYQKFEEQGPLQPIWPWWHQFLVYSLLVMSVLVQQNKPLLQQVKGPPPPSWFGVIFGRREYKLINHWAVNQLHFSWSHSSKALQSIGTLVGNSLIYFEIRQ
jgi:hypothetical protein